MSTLLGKRALVCGSTRGIGRACAEEFAWLGAQVILLARDEKTLGEVRDRLPRPETGSGKEVSHQFLCADFRSPEAVRQVVQAHLKDNGPIDVLLNNTGGPPAGPILGSAPEAFLDFFSRHLVCNQYLVQAVVPGMKEGGFGRILNIISTSVKEPIRSLGVSNTIRGAVASWSKTLAGELAPFGITVNNILPGATRTDRLESLIRERSKKTGKEIASVEEEMLAAIPAGRFARAEEIAAAAGFLASPAAGYITGINLPVDGGRISSL